MPDLTFRILGAEVVPDSIAPAIAIFAQIGNRSPSEQIQTILLRAQVQIETPRRRYSRDEQGKLLDVFGEPARWGQTLRPMLWTNAFTTVPAFKESTVATLTIPCSFDFDVAVTKYFHALGDGVVPVRLMFSGTVFYPSQTGSLQVAPISWNSEAEYAFPVDVWKRSVDLHYPNSAWLCLRRDVFERVNDFRTRHGMANFDQTLERMMETCIEVGA